MANSTGCTRVFGSAFELIGCPAYLQKKSLFTYDQLRPQAAPLNTLPDLPKPCYPENWTAEANLYLIRVNNAKKWLRPTARGSQVKYNHCEAQ